VTDLLTREEALAILRENAPHKRRRCQEMEQRGFPAYTTSTGWLGYSDEDVRRRCTAAYEEGFRAFKMKVGVSVEDDRRRAALMRDCLGWDVVLAMDANCVWEIPEAIAWMGQLAEFNPYWIEEPTCPDDALGHAAIRKALARHNIHVATGEQMANRVMHKQFLQAGGYTIAQTDCNRLAGLNEFLVVALMAKKSGVRVCQHAGGVGLCALAAHASMAEFVCVSGSTEGRWCEYIDHLSEHFITPVVCKSARYLAPECLGWGLDMRSESIKKFSFPSGELWLQRPGHFDISLRRLANNEPQDDAEHEPKKRKVAS